MGRILIFYVPCPDQKTADLIAGELLDKGKIACANSFPIRSSYMWNRVKEESQEITLLLKTVPELKDSLLHRIEALHPYEVPCIVFQEVQCNAKYAMWVKSEVNKG